MSEQSLVRQPNPSNNRRELRAIFRQYLQASRKDERLVLETLNTTHGLPHNWIYDLFQDSQGRVWVATWGGGAGCYQEGKWKVYTTASGLHSNAVTCIREDGDGRIWLATDAGLNCLEDGQMQEAGLGGKSLLHLAFDRGGRLWVGCWRAAHSGGGLFCFDGENWQTFSTQSDLPGLEILKVFPDSRNRIWVGTYEGGSGAGVGCYDGRRWQKYTTQDGLVNDCVYSMFEDPGGNLWFGTVGGISIFDGRRWHTLGRKDGLVDERVYCMMIDSHQKMWFGTEAGVNRFDGTTWQSYTKKDGLVEDLVRTILETKEASMWFGTYPYAVGAGGISIGRYPTGKALTEQVLDLLPEPPQPKQLPKG